MSAPAGDRRRRASVLANAIGDDEEAGRQARELLRVHRELAAPDLVDVETTAVLRRRWFAGTIPDERFATRRCARSITVLPTLPDHGAPCS